MAQVILSNSQVVPSSGESGPGVVDCTEQEAEEYVLLGYGTRVAGS